MESGHIFKDRRKLLPGYVPEKLVNREDETRELVRLFRPTLERGSSQRASIQGVRGTGKTAVARRFGTEIERAAEKRNVRLKCLPIDCREHRTEFQIARDAALRLNLNVPRLGFSAHEYLQKISGGLKDGGAHLVIILDWLDFYVRRSGPDLLYKLTRDAEGTNGQNRLSVIGTTRSSDFTDMLDDATRSTFMHNCIRLDKYSPGDLRKILENRAGSAFRPGAVGEESLELISRTEPWVDGAGFAIEWLRASGEIAERKGDDKVRPDHVLEAKGELHPRPSNSTLRALPRHELVILLGLARKLDEGRCGLVRTGDLKKGYAEICEELGEEKRSRSSLYRSIDDLSRMGILKVEPTGGGWEGNTLRIGLPDGSASHLKSEIEKLLRS